MEPSRSGDRLSDLPDSLIFEIFWFLPLTEVVRTTILSKRWKGLWKTAPFLNIEDSADTDFTDYMTNEVADRFRALGNGALILWRGTKILRLKINFHNKFSQPFFNDVDVWVLLATENGAEEVDLNLGVERYLVPHCLYSCSSLKVLSLGGCHLRIDGNVKWDQLKSLTIWSLGVVSENVVNLILSGSPRLEVFVLVHEDSDESLCIRSSSLRKLSIRKRLLSGSRDALSTNTGLKIWTPNLEWLEILGFPYGKCLLMDVSSFTHAGFEYFDPCLKMWDYLLEEALGQILPKIDRLQSVTLSDWFIKVLGIMKRKHMLSPLSNVKLLKLGILKQHEEIAGLLEYFPNVKRLVLKYEGDRYHYQNGGDLLEFEFEPDLPNLFLLQLRTVEVTWVEGNNSMFPLIQILLKYASKLEKMVFQVDETRDYLFWASQKVLKMPRSSPAAELIFCENRS